MDFLNGLIGAAGGVVNGIGHLFGNQPAPKPVVKLPPNNNLGKPVLKVGAMMQQPQAKPVIQAPAPKITPRQQASQNFLDESGHVNPNYQSPSTGIGADVKEAAKGVYHTMTDPITAGYHNAMNNSNADLKAAASTGAPGSPERMAATAKALPKATLDFAKGFFQSGTNAAAFVAPEAKGIELADPAAQAARSMAAGDVEGALKAASIKAPSTVMKVGAGLLRYGATSAPISIAGNMANGNHNPASLAENALMATLMAGAIPGMKDAAVKANASVGEGGYLKFPGSDKMNADQYRAAIKQKLAMEAAHFSQNEADIRANAKSYAGGSKVVSDTKAMFKEFTKNPDAFIDKYKLLPPALREEAKATSVDSGQTGSVKTKGQPATTETKISPPSSGPQPPRTPADLKESLSSTEADKLRENATANTNQVKTKGQPVHGAPEQPTSKQTVPAEPKPEPVKESQNVSSDNSNTMSKISQDDLQKAADVFKMKPEDLNKKSETPSDIARRAFVMKYTKPNVEGGYYQTIEMRPNMASGKMEQTLVEHVPEGGGYHEYVVPPNGRAQHMPEGDKQGPFYSKVSPEDLKRMDEENPVKVNIGQVKAGDFERARHVPLQATSPTQVAGKIFEYSASRLSKAEKGIFNDAVEHPEDHKDASPALKQAVQDWRNLVDRVNATSHALGGEEARIKNYLYHDVHVSTPEEKATVERITGEPYDPNNFRGVNALARMKDARTGRMAFPDVRTLHEAGLKLEHEGDPQKMGREYTQNAVEKLGRQAVKKAFTEADSESVNKPHSVDFGDGAPLMLSKEALPEIKGYVKTQAAKGSQMYDKVSGATKGFLLSTSQYHPQNVNMLTAFPSLVLQGHPLLAAKGALDTIRTGPLVPGAKGLSAKLARQDLESGLVEKSAEIGMPMGRSDYAPNGEVAKGHGEGIVFGRQIPAMYRNVAKATVNDLEKRNIPLDSPEARQAGKTGNNIMGFISAKAQNLSPLGQRIISRLLLAPQFEMSKLNLIKTALDPTKPITSLARRNAVATIFGKYALEAGLGIAGGALLHQQSNNIMDDLKEALVNPYIPSNQKATKGNTIKYKMPDTGPSEITNLGVSLNRGTDGRLHLSVNNPATIAGNIESDLNDKLSPLLSTGTKILTNQNYAGKPLYQSNAPFGTKVEQAAATLGTDLLPIGLQGVAQTKTVDKFLPKNMSEVLQENKPGSNPVVKSAFSTVGLTPETDQSTGKGLQSKQYYDEVTKVTHGFNQNEMAAWNVAFPMSKDPVTGQYINNNVNSNLTMMTSLKADVMKAYPQVLAAATQLNKQMAKDGQKVDPFYTQLTTSQQKAYMNYESMPTAGPDRQDWLNKNPWYSKFANDRTNYFNSLPAGDPNKPQSPIKYPTPSAAITDEQNLYDRMTATTNPNAWTSAQKSSYLNDHPELINQWADQSNYDNQVRVATGYSPLKLSPNATPQMEKYIQTYNAASKADRKTMRNSDPASYQAMIAYYDEADIATINKEGAVSEIQGEPAASQSELKAIGNIAQDIYAIPGANGNTSYAIEPAAWLTGGVGTPTNSGGSSGYSSGSTSKIAGGAPVFKAPTTFSASDSKLTSALKASMKQSKPKALSGKVSKSYHVKKVSMKSSEKLPALPKKRTASMSSDGLVKLGI